MNNPEMKSEVHHHVSLSKAPILILFVRTLLFGFIQTLFILIFSISWVESIPWWPIIAILSNIICYFLISFLAKRENKSYLDIIHFDKSKLIQDLKAVWWVLIIGGVVGGIGLNGVGFFMYGSFMPPDNIIQPLPIWAAIIGLILFPITNALVEVPLYMGYCLSRLEVQFNSKILALILSSFFLAFQHITLPITINDYKFMIWHFVSMLPLAFVVGLVYLKIRRLVPIMIVHYIMDVLAIIGLFMVSLDK
ncbi:CPBP family intramembrane glutamic endopeptidase [Bacillus sp. DTU_2020_1000418_1_SI_GHA_SEK_038]|uniref:CPBP family intramembrane glutamic endopeptidase n=1 Tax=Bacillus sp. DTU_2020_1000418_1_SI_GHA_SEK_038 TaxID=3077585 RepID=UPI0028E2188C|nr:CPBP family intramembrane glutamic endopeptidase [Bacillus sp. DTU_2020_1000418_1_SI_GHA_SEK_038]WNS76466.1 CPBP family intramembrane glutamic endopeptidase [Bacillus sp. DTU_2020_1000418_1_SI_GHA_SEK_038]